MKTIVSVNEISEFEIKPKNELAIWKKMVSDEICSKWPNKENWILVDCPVCNKSNYTNAFNKDGFEYVECIDCKTLYSRNRPSEEDLNKWYLESNSVNYWQTKLLNDSSSIRDAKIIEPRSQWILDSISENISNYNGRIINFLDISFFGKMLIEKLYEKTTNFNMISGGITASRELYKYDKISVIPILKQEDLRSYNKIDVVVAFDVFDRINSIHKLMEDLEDVVNPGGLVFATCPVSSGFEIQTLWDKSPTILPPDKLTLPSINALLNKYKHSTKWELIELSTPGMFDVELVMNEVEKNKKEWPRNLNAILNGINNQGIGILTEYLQSQRLSSFARILFKRKEQNIF